MHCSQWIFDMDGTLTDSMTVVWEGAPDALLRRYGRTPRGDLRATLLNMGMQEGAQYLIREYGLPLTEESYFSVMREVIAELYETVELRAHEAGKAAGRGRTHVHLLQHLGRTVPHRAYPAGHRAVFLLHRGSTGRAAQKPPGGVL